jgi:hypothetical protein
MNPTRNHKCVIVLKTGLPAGFAANAAAVLAISLGKLRPEIVAEDLLDGSGLSHAGLVNVPVPLLQAEAPVIKRIRDSAVEDKNITVVDFSEPARVARTFEAYRELLATTSKENLEYVGVALLGAKELVSSLTAGLPLLR